MIFFKKQDEENKTQKVQTTHEHFKSLLILAQAFSLLPINGITAKKPTSLKFKWISWRLLYSVFIFTCLVFVISVAFYHFAMYERKFFQTVEQIFYIASLITTILYLHLANVWPKLMLDWYLVDLSMSHKYNFPQNLGKRIKITSMILMILASVEHLLSIIFHITTVKRENNGTLEFEKYYETVYPQIFQSVQFTYGLAVVVQIVSIFATFFWNYNDLFIILTSCTIAIRFKQVTKRLKNHGNETSLLYWIEIREDYERLSNLCRKLDDALSYLVLHSFAINLFFILIQLFHSLKTIKSIIEKVYFFYSFGFLILRTVAVSLYAAWINDESKEPAHILNSLPSQCYNNEVRRLHLQIIGDNVALTGCKMFKVTRGLILNVAGAIVTYELVLIQFNSNALITK